MYQNKTTLLNSKLHVGQNISYLEESFAYAESIIEKHSKSFSFASKFLDQDTKNSVVSLYAFCRYVDDIVDETNLDANTTNEILNQLKYTVELLYYENVSQDPVLYAFGYTIRKHNIPKKYIIDLIEGVRMDLYKHNYSNFNELYKYCYRVASTVGLMMTHIFLDQPSKETLKKAEYLGIAMQLTNILRDVSEDYSKGRIYLTKDWLELFKVNPNNLSTSYLNNDGRNLIKHVIRLTKEFYKKGYEGIDDLPPGADFVVALSGEIYSGILDEIENNNHQVLSKRHFVSKFRKLRIATKLRLKYRRSLKKVKRGPA